MYDHDRFFTVTGDVFEGRGRLGANPGVIERAYRTWIEPDRNRGAASSSMPIKRAAQGGDSDDELIERMYASRSGAVIRALMTGDTSAQGGDHSAADMALCSHLAFWCAGDAERMDRIFRTSGLMRDKWDSRRGSTTYGAQTIERAIAQVGDFYRPRAPRDKNMCSTALRPEAAGEGDTEADSAPTDGAPSVEGWLVDDRGRLWTVDREGELRHTVTSTAPWIACDLVDVDTGDVRALVRVAVPGGVRERALDREVLLNQSRIIGAPTPPPRTPRTSCATSPTASAGSAGSARAIAAWCTWVGPTNRSARSCPTTAAAATCASTPPPTRR